MAFHDEGPVDRFLNLVRPYKPKSDGGWSARCPAHEDQKASLSVNRGADGRVLLRCFAGCDHTAIAKAVGLNVSDLFVPDDRHPSASGTKSAGRLTVARFAESKGFELEFLSRRGFRDIATLTPAERAQHNVPITEQRGILIPYKRRDGSLASRHRHRRALVAKDGSTWFGATGEAIEPYLLELLDHARQTEVLVVSEGETDSLAVLSADLGVRILGVPSAGMVKCLRPEYLQGVRRVYVTVDRDPAGEGFLEHVRVAVTATGMTDIYAVRMPDGCKDVDDLRRREGSRFAATLKTLLTEAKSAGPVSAPTLQVAATSKSGPDGDLSFTHLHDLLAEPEEQYDWVADGLIGKSTCNILAGKPKAGKSTVARHGALEVAKGGWWLGRRCTPGPVWYCAFEERRGEVRRHFRAMGATGQEPVRVFIARAPEDALEQLHAQAQRERPSLIIIDTLQRLIRCRDMNDYAETTARMEPVLALARETGAALLLVHHAGKGVRAGTDAVLGSTALSGSVDNVFVLSRNDMHQRFLTSIQRIGEDLPETLLVLDRESMRVTLGLTREASEHQTLAAEILTQLASAPDGLEEKQIVTQVEGRTKALREVLRALLCDDKVIRQGRGRRGDPYIYRLPVSCSLVPQGIREQENEKAILPVSDGVDTSYSRSQIPAGADDPEQAFVALTSAGYEEI
jgi:AAA domain/Toprim domain